MGTEMIWICFALKVKDEGRSSLLPIFVKSIFIQTYNNSPSVHKKEEKK